MFTNTCLCERWAVGGDGCWVYSRNGLHVIKYTNLNYYNQFYIYKHLLFLWDFFYLSK